MTRKIKEELAICAVRVMTSCFITFGVGLTKLFHKPNDNSIFMSVDDLYRDENTQMTIFPN